MKKEFSRASFRSGFTAAFPVANSSRTAHCPVPMKSPPASLLEERSILPTNEPQQSAQTAQTTTTREKRFDWPLCYDAENFILNQIASFLDRNTFASKLAERMRVETGTLMVDWVDYLVQSAAEEEALRNIGFSDDPLGERLVSTLK